MKYAFVINPIAGKKKAQEPFARAVKEYFAENEGDFEIFYTDRQGAAEKYARELALTGQEVRIYACGGEGTAYEVLNGIVGFENAALGVVPCGSANDFITYFSEKTLFLDVPDQIAGEVFDIDLIQVGDRYAINSCSVGLDAMVAANMSKFKKLPFVSGQMAYVLSLLYTLFGKMGINLKVDANKGERKIEKNSLFAVVANAPFYGGGFYPTPDANPFDGHLNYSVVSSVSRLKILSLLDKYRKGEHLKLDICDYGDCENITVSADKKVPLNMDGEIVFVKNATFNIVKKAGRLILPKSIAKVWKEKTGVPEMANY